MKWSLLLLLAIIGLAPTFSSADDDEGVPPDPDNDLDPLPADDQVDQWESVPLPPPSEADLIRDSEAILIDHQSEVRQEIEEELVEAYKQLDQKGGKMVERKEIDKELMMQESIIAAGGIELPEIFNTDDFDDDYDDVDGDTPLAPPVV
jgi:hypothetical protein